MSINYKASNGILIEGIHAGKHFEILFSDIQPFWQYATEEDFEGGKAKLYGSYLVANILTASGQGGIIFVWDVGQAKLISCFESQYCIDFAFNNNEIYSLHYVSYWGITPYFELSKIEIITGKSEVVPTKIPFNVDDYNGQIDSINMGFNEEGVLYISFNGTNHNFDII